MALEDFFDHRCNIYHIIVEGSSPGFNLPAAPSFSYPTEADLKEVPCHFGIHSRSESVYQQAPENTLNQSIKLTLPVGTDIRFNDRVVDCDTGLEYTANIPHNIRGHHKYVYVEKKDMWREKDL